MKTLKHVILIILWIAKAFDCEPFTLGVGLTLTGMAAAPFIVKKGYCHAYECCEAPWISNGCNSIYGALKGSLFGQHLVMKIIPGMIQSHRKDNNPQKPLALAFHGSTGTGKNFVSAIIANHLYYKGMESKFVHKFISSHLFPNQNLLQSYRNHIKNTLRAVISMCERALFIIDEFDKMPMGLIDTFKPYLDYHEKVDGYDFRKSIFIFMGNTGVNEINEVTLKFFKDGKDRETITMKSMQKLLRAVAYQSGGLKKAALLENHLIDFHVPFLPLEKKHIYKCVEEELARTNKRISVEKVKAVANELEYFPKDDKIYSVPGCKSVASLAEIFG